MTAVDVRLREFFTRMVRIRRCEEALLKSYHPADLMRCPTHFCIGQEAGPAALSPLLRPRDLVFCHHRNHGYYLAKGGSMRRLFAEMHGKEAGSNRGLAGSQDISESAVGFYSGAIVAGAAAIATGAAFAARRRGGDDLVVTVFGDGAMDQGVMWESFNIAALKGLPILFVCDNNLYSTYSPIAARHAVPDFTTKVAAFGVETPASIPAKRRSPPRRFSRRAESSLRCACFSSRATSSTWTA
jgi:pyruvate dehydrogenase E1 component alpha subunit